MKKTFLFCFISLIASILLSAQPDSLLKLWYTHPAEKWVEALPVGNGQLGAMVYGDPQHETIQLNENTIWAGEPNRNDNPNALKALPEVRKLIFEGKYKQAQDLANKTFISQTSQGMPYQAAGNLHLFFPDHENYTSYYRELDLTKALTTTRYTVNGIDYTTSVFASAPDQVIIVRITADKPGSVSFNATMDRPSKVNLTTEGNDKIILSGITSDHETVKGRVKFEAQVKVKPTGGTLSSNDTAISLTGADAATIYISIGTNFNNYEDITGDASLRATTYLEKAMQIKYPQALEDHIADYQQYFKRVSLNLGVTDAVKNPTDERIAKFATDNDPQLVALYFQFGRYLLISSSRPGGQPANLQGIWNNQLFPPWDSKYTVNINTEMNYWPSEITNLTEMNEPLINMLHELSKSGRRTAKVMYGADGWVLHHNTDIWRINGPVDGAFWGLWPMGGAWLCQHLWEKYAYSGDKEYLKSVYPVMKSAVKFYLSFLVPYPGHDWLVVCPSVSPENAPAAHPDASISAGTTMDNQLLFDLFTRTIQAANMLNIDQEFTTEIRKSLEQTAPNANWTIWSVAGMDQGLGQS